MYYNSNFEALPVVWAVETTLALCPRLSLMVATVNSYFIPGVRPWMQIFGTGTSEQSRSPVLSHFQVTLNLRDSVSPSGGSQLRDTASCATDVILICPGGGRSWKNKDQITGKSWGQAVHSRQNSSYVTKVNSLVTFNMVQINKTGAQNTDSIVSGSFSYACIWHAIWMTSAVKRQKTDVSCPLQFSYIQRNT